MPLLLDGNNLLHRLPHGQRSRERLRALVLALARHESVRVVVVFDGAPPPGTPERERLGAVTVEYSAPLSADERILARLPNGNAARQWTVFTDDRALSLRVRGAGAKTRPTAALLDRLGADPTTERRDGLRPDEVAEWESYFRRGRRDD